MDAIVIIAVSQIAVMVLIVVIAEANHRTTRQLNHQTADSRPEEHSEGVAQRIEDISRTACGEVSLREFHETSHEDRAEDAASKESFP